MVPCLVETTGSRRGVRGGRIDAAGAQVCLRRQRHRHVLPGRLVAAAVAARLPGAQRARPHQRAALVPQQRSDAAHARRQNAQRHQVVLRLRPHPARQSLARFSLLVPRS